MSGPITMILWCWAAASPLAFRLLPGRDAAIACLVAGWAILPAASPSPSDLEGGGRWSSAHALAVPRPHQLTKATAIGLGCLAGLVAFDRRAFDRTRPGLVDLPMVATCLVPLASAASNGLPLSEGLAQARAMALGWGVPYLMGRAYLIDEASRGRFAVALAAGGLAYLPACLLEVVAGPTIYRLAYGPHPYEFDGAARGLGFRPLVLLEHGNQLGMWMANSALAATWLWASGADKRPGGVPGGVLAALLVGATLACRSDGSIALLAAALLPLAWARPRWRRPIVAGLGLAGLALAVVLARRGLAEGSPRLVARDLFRGIGKSSFTWRLARTEEFLPTALRRPWLGRARADWRGDGLPFLNPVALSTWLLELGMYGLAGLSALLATWLLPLIRPAGPPGRRSWLGPEGGATGALAAVVAINLLDGCMNSTVILPILAAVGGLARPAGRPRVAPLTLDRNPGPTSATPGAGDEAQDPRP